ncbi:MAG: hypothetical protein Q7S98_03935 [Deltaproteobacteria bacterium]|nr:hypothetical protein [Deltaproteobacteria bacterium]
MALTFDQGVRIVDEAERIIRQLAASGQSVPLSDDQYHGFAEGINYLAEGNAARLHNDKNVREGLRAVLGFVRTHTTDTDIREALQAAAETLSDLLGPIDASGQLLRSTRLVSVVPPWLSDSAVTRDQMVADNQFVRAHGYTHADLAHFLKLAAAMLRQQQEYQVEWDGIHAGRGDPADRPPAYATFDYNGMDFTVRGDSVALVVDNVTKGLTFHFSPPIISAIEQYGWFNDPVSENGRLSPEVILSALDPTIPPPVEVAWPQGPTFHHSGFIFVLEAGLTSIQQGLLPATGVVVGVEGTGTGDVVTPMGNYFATLLRFIDPEFAEGGFYQVAGYASPDYDVAVLSFRGQPQRLLIYDKEGERYLTFTGSALPSPTVQSWIHRGADLSYNHEDHSLTLSGRNQRDEELLFQIAPSDAGDEGWEVTARGNFDEVRRLLHEVAGDFGDPDGILTLDRVSEPADEVNFYKRGETKVLIRRTKEGVIRDVVVQHEGDRVFGWVNVRDEKGRLHHIGLAEGEELLREHSLIDPTTTPPLAFVPIRRADGTTQDRSVLKLTNILVRRVSTDEVVLDLVYADGRHTVTVIDPVTGHFQEQDFQSFRDEEGEEPPDKTPPPASAPPVAPAALPGSGLLGGGEGGGAQAISYRRSPIAVRSSFDDGTLLRGEDPIPSRSSDMVREISGVGSGISPEVYGPSADGVFSLPIASGRFLFP